MANKDDALQLIRDTVDSKIDVHGLQPDTWLDAVKKSPVGYRFYVTTDNRFFMIRVFKERISEFCGVYQCMSILTTPLTILEKIHQHRLETAVTNNDLVELIHPDTLSQFCKVLKAAPTYRHSLDNSLSDIQRKCWPSAPADNSRAAMVG